MLTQDQRAEFGRTGLLLLRGAVPVADADAMADHLWSFLSRRSGVDREDPATWTVARPTAFQAASRAGHLDGMWSAPVCAAVDDLLGPTGTHRERPRVLMTFPEVAQPWTVPSAGWHFDYVPSQAEPGLRAMTSAAAVTSGSSTEQWSTTCRCEWSRRPAAPATSTSCTPTASTLSLRTLDRLPGSWRRASSAACRPPDSASGVRAGLQGSQRR